MFLGLPSSGFAKASTVRQSEGPVGNLLIALRGKHRLVLASRWSTVAKDWRHEMSIGTLTNWTCYAAVARAFDDSEIALTPTSTEGSANGEARDLGQVSLVCPLVSVSRLVPA